MKFTHVHTCIQHFVHITCISQMLLNVNFSSRTTSMDVQRNLEANVEKRMKDVYGPPPGVCLCLSALHPQCTVHTLCMSRVDV